MAAELNKVIAGEYDSTGKAIVYGDTDSTYFSAYPVLSTSIDMGEIAWDKDTIIEYYDAVGEEVNKTFRFSITTTSSLHITGKIIATGPEIVKVEAGNLLQRNVMQSLCMIMKVNVRTRMENPARLRLWV